MTAHSQIQFNFAQATDVGCVRELNEDSVYSENGLWLLADGMGGHACGEVASALAIEEIKTSVSEGNSLEDAIQKAHTEITQAGQADTSKEGMGTTIVAVISDGINYSLAWVGDSRAYLWDKSLQKLTQLSQDHSLMVRLVNSGLITEEDALTHPQRHMITQCLGTAEMEQVNVDSIQCEWQFQQQRLLCSDGLSDEASHKKIEEIMSLNSDIADKTDQLIELAKDSGGRDNISIIIVDSPIQQPPSFLSKIKKLAANLKLRIKR